MSMAWLILFAMAAEAGGHGVSPGPDPARPACRPAARSEARATSPSHSLSVARRTWHRACPGYWTLTGLEEFDTEEVDESWMVHLDAVATVPGSWLCLAWSRSGSWPRADRAVPSLSPSYFPLRC